MMNDRNREEQVRGADPGLCGGCEHVQQLTSSRGSTFYLCRLSFADSRFARYQPLPVQWFRACFAPGGRHVAAPVPGTVTLKL